MLVLRARPGGFVHLGTPCSSWVPPPPRRVDIAHCCRASQSAHHHVCSKLWNFRSVLTWEIVLVEQGEWVRIGLDWPKPLAL